jgi:hypothetical protein
MKYVGKLAGEKKERFRLCSRKRGIGNGREKCFFANKNNFVNFLLFSVLEINGKTSKKVRQATSWQRFSITFTNGLE